MKQVVYNEKNVFVSKEIQKEKKNIDKKVYVKNIDTRNVYS